MLAEDSNPNRQEGGKRRHFCAGLPECEACGDQRGDISLSPNMQHLPKYVSERRSAWIAQEPVRLDVIRTQSEPYRNPKEPFSIACQNPFSFHLCWRNCFGHIPSLLPRARGLTTADTLCPLETPFNCTIARWIDKRLEHNYIAVYSLYRKKHETYQTYHI